MLLRRAVVSGTIPAAGRTVALPLVPNLNGALYVVGVTVDLATFQWRSFSPRGRV